MKPAERLMQGVNRMSPPTRGRELKPGSMGEKRRRFRSPPTRGRELKQH